MTCTCKYTLCSFSLEFLRREDGKKCSSINQFAVCHYTVIITHSVSRQTALSYENTDPSEAQGFHIFHLLFYILYCVCVYFIYMYSFCISFALQGIVCAFLREKIAGLVDAFHNMKLFLSFTWRCITARIPQGAFRRNDNISIRTKKLRT